MKVTRTNRRGAVILILSICCARAAFGGDDALAQAKDLYATAAYDEALAVLDRLQGNAAGKDATPIAEYRAFCLLALNRRDEARRTIEAIFSDNPRYLPSEDLASPRIQAVFRETRRQVLPKIVRERYAAAKAAFERKDAEAGKQFEEVLALLDDPDVQSVPALTDLRTVVSAFHDLTVAMAGPPVQPPLQTAGDRTSLPAQNEVQAQPPVNSNIVYTEGDADVVPAVAMSQRVPRWEPRARDAMQDFRGTLELLVDERGVVMSATLRASVHPVYDAELLKAVRGWKFTPATKQGIPVRYLKVIAIRLTPARTNGR